MVAARYLVYETLGRNVEITDVGGRKVGRGVVGDVVRDVFANEVVIRVGAKTLRFREPDRIEKGKSSIILEYGDRTGETNEQVFEGMVDAAYAGDTLEEYLHDTAARPIKKVHIKYVSS